MTKTDVLLLLTAVALNTSASILVKKGSGAILGGQKITSLQSLSTIISPAVNTYTIVGLGLLGLSFVAYIFVLSRVQLSIAQPMLALSYVLIGISAHFFFGETLTPLKLFGTGAIVFGVFLISRAWRL